MQPLVVVNDRVRFKPNTVVRHLLDRGSIDLNRIAAVDFPQEDLDQFYQLIGYSVDDYHELSETISDESAKAAAHAACAQFGTKYSRCLEEETCPVHRGGKR